jgi:hypothetical protein
MATTATPGGLFAFFRNLRDSILALRHAPPTLWAIFLVQFLENVAYFSVPRSRSPRATDSKRGAR